MSSPAEPASSRYRVVFRRDGVDFESSRTGRRCSHRKNIETNRLDCRVESSSTRLDHRISDRDDVDLYVHVIIERIQSALPLDCGPP